MSNSFRNRLERIGRRAISPFTETPKLGRAIARIAGRLDAVAESVDDSASSTRGRIDELSELVKTQGAAIATLEASLREARANDAVQLALARAAYDRIPELRWQLAALRASDEYAAAMEDPNPLVSVTIPTFNSASTLIDRAIPSVLEQTYTNWELVIVGDGCTDDTAARVAAIGDPRIRFFNFPYRGVYPDDRGSMWKVAGVIPINHAFATSKGAWIAKLDDDDRFTPDHIEVLLRLAQRTRSEVAYGQLDELDANGARSRTIYSFPPRHSHFGFQASIQLRGLRFFGYDIHAWAMDEPADSNLVRRMLAAGVLMTGIERTVGYYYPSMGARV